MNRYIFNLQRVQSQDSFLKNIHIKLPYFGKSSTVSNEFVTDPDVLVNNLSFSHIREIMVLNDAFERFFYETECMKCNWNVRELRRQIKTNLYVRAGISK